MCMPPLWPKAHPLDEQTSAFAGDVIGDLSQFPKRLSPKYFYDAAGSELFEQITVLPEYYPTRTELGILRSRGDEIAAIIPEGRGAGGIRRRRHHQGPPAAGALRFRRLCAGRHFRRFPERAGRARLRKDFPELGVYPVAADFTAPFALPAEIAGMPKVGFFPGSTLGNFEPHEARAFLRSARDILGEGAQMIIGVDLEKNERVLYDAYNDAAGVTARFNLNVLVRINRELGGNFDVSAFMHRSIYNRERHRIEMHLISQEGADRAHPRAAISHSARAKASTPRSATNTASTASPRWRAAPAGRCGNPGPTANGCFRFTRWRRQTERVTARRSLAAHARVEPCEVRSCQVRSC